MVDRNGKLQKEISQSRPFDSLSQEAVLGVLKTADLLRREIAAVVAPARLTLQQYNVLRILRGAGKEGLPILEIADRLIEQSPGITRFVDHLEERGLVVREHCSQDRRRIFCKITPAGLKLLASLDEPIREWLETSLNMLKPEKVGQLIQTLDRVRAAHNN